MAKKTAEDTSLKTLFDQQQATHTDLVLEEAQRLVNLYHHASAFGPKFSEQLDAMLLATTPEVQSALSEILGGAVVRRYAEFLKDQKNPKSAEKTQDEDETAPTPAQTGYLPSPEDDPVVAPSAAPVSNGINTAAVESLFKNFILTHQVELERLLRAQTETLSQVMQRVDQTTHDVASRETDRLIHALQQETGKQKKYSDVIEATQAAATPPDETEGP